jgi:hypothetical protein
MKKLYTKMSLALMSLLVIFGAQHLHAQQIDYEWGFGTGPSGSSSESVEGICFDVDGNMYVSGTFTGSVDFDPSPANVVLTATDQSFSITDNTFILKFDSDSTLIWAKQFNNGYNINNALAYDGADGLYLTGMSQFPVDFDPGTGVENASPVDFGYYLCKLDTAGNFQWVRKGRNGAGGSGIRANFLAYDDLNNSIVSGGYFVGNSLEIADETGSVLGGITLPISTARHFFTVSYSASGDLQWANSLAATSNSRLFDMNVDNQGNVLLGGRFNGALDMDPGVGSVIENSVGNVDGFLIKLDSQGNWVGHIIAEGTANTEVHEIAVDENDSIVIAISYTGDITLGTEWGLGSAQTETTVGLHDVMLVKMNNNFIASWYKKLGGTNATGSDYIYDMELTGSNIYVGVLSNSGFFDFEPTSSFELSGNGDFDVYTAVYTANGDLIDAAGIGGAGRDFLGAFDISNDGRIATGGYFESFSIDLDPTSGVDSYSNQGGGGNGNRDIFFNQMSFCASSVDITTSDDGATITANEDAAGASYQWIDCSDDSDISGETSSTFTPTETGDYACIITNGCAVDTTDCVSITVATTSINEPSIENVSLYPNPASNNVNIQGLKKIDKVEITSVTGRQMKVSMPIENEINVVDYPSGIYFVKIYSEGKILNKKLIKK